MKPRNALYRNKFKDEIVRIPRDDGEFSLSVRHRHLFKNCPIEINTQTGEAFVYSDDDIPGLEKVGSNEIPNPNINRKQDHSKFPTKEDVM